jgi:hypothetical protein
MGLFTVSAVGGGGGGGGGVLCVSKACKAKPQCPQKRCPGWVGDPHCGHEHSSGVPHDVQNLLFTSLSAPHEPQRTATNLAPIPEKLDNAYTQQLYPARPMMTHCTKSILPENVESMLWTRADASFKDESIFPRT